MYLQSYAKIKYETNKLTFFLGADSKKAKK